ncbi:uncharacterized protein PODANS_5_4270 [Podospora anserina S mat+]|uniref:Podospora anserina S mat+ genomic DNA chromosome 5, supercontig 4 n=1 Tax=Podospora anserina (strain S / ATCC MYA-4624 / DSM 980 / FGSC 10383) TaxID=515849 RepID=B2ALP7_PODAN|nr:uncharacterized protein PODANS_5_4270 [Podospora anserina S mat+]CAP64885.1 unnamed protein product [Podospora anserina S mat+]CDP29398.1 Putative protein of unknown function [Podospora anserina S mat+]
MSAPLTDEETTEYSRIIDGILAAADLQTVTRKKIRQGLEAAIEKDLSDQKEAIKKLIEARFDAVSANNADATPPETNGYSPEDGGEDGGEDGEIQVSLQPAKKKVKRESSSEDADRRLAAELQAQENALSRARVTRGAGTTKPKAKPKAKAAKNKSAKRVRSDDDSEVEDGEEKPKRKAGGGFQKPFNLSEALADVCGEPQLSRPQVVKKLWDHIKANELQDPNDKRNINCDEKLRAVFRQDKINMFSMNKLLGSQLYPIEEA